MITTDPRSAPSLGKQCGDSLQEEPANGSSERDLPNHPIAKDLPAGASAKIRAKPVSDRRQSQLAAWTAAIEDRQDLTAFLESIVILITTFNTGGKYMKDAGANSE